MNFWPEKSFIINTQLSPEEVIERLKSNTEEREINQTPTFNIPKYKPKKYIGIINSTDFTLYNNTTLYSLHSAKRSFYIVINGLIETEQKGTQISFKLQYDNGQKETIYILLFIALLIITVVAIYYEPLIALLALLIPSIAYFVFRRNLNFYTKKNQEVFNTILRY